MSYYFFSRWFVYSEQDGYKMWRIALKADGGDALIWNERDPGNDCPPLDTG